MAEQNTFPLLRILAERYETADFLTGDPSWFMHQVSGRQNQEAMAFVASCLSYGSRKQFMPKIQQILDYSKGDVDNYIREKRYEPHFKKNDSTCFYRLYSTGKMRDFFDAYNLLLLSDGSLGKFVEARARDGFSALCAITDYFSKQGLSVIIPKDVSSACKRICMFMRWMVRSNSPVDLGLWSTFIDKRSLIMPLDTHVVNQSHRLGLIDSKQTSMRTAQKLTQTMLEVFPDDPLKGDFALFGYGIDVSSK